MAAAAAAVVEKENGDEELRRDVGELADLLSKLNPAAEEFVPSYGGGGWKPAGKLSADSPVFFSTGSYCSDVVVGRNYYYVDGFGGYGSADNQQQRRDNRKRNRFYNGRRMGLQKLRKAQKETVIRRTVYVSEIDQTVTEEVLADLFSSCGQIEDCRICGDPRSALRFAFIEFSDEFAARSALSLSGTMLGPYNLKVLPSKTAILPVNPSFLPQSETERDMCSRTIYCTNIDKKVAQADVKEFFESACGEVSRLRLLGDTTHSTRIAFIEFALADSAVLALNCSGMMLGTLPIRVSPSKTPVRPRTPRATEH